MYWLVFSALLLAAARGQVPSPTCTWTYSQTLDHFSFGETSKILFPQRVLEYNKFWVRSSGEVGPLFVFIANEGHVDNFYQNSGFIFDIAPQFGALVVFIEHRYYGESLPFGPEKSFTNQNLAHLSSNQATADFAEIIDHIKKERNINQVVTFGGSYGGMLAAWLRMRYPQLVDAALASSAPVKMMTKTGHPEKSFHQIATDDFAAANVECPGIVQRGFTKLYALVKTTGYQDAITETFSLCSQFNMTQFDHLVGWARNSLRMMAIGNYPYPADFFGALPAWPVKTACNMMLDEMSRSGDELKALVVAAGLFYNGTEGTKECFDIYEEFEDSADVSDCGAGPTALAWDWQSCTEFTLTTPSNNKTDMFPPSNWNEDLVNAYCRTKYGVTPDPVKASLSYWSADFTTASNIIFSNGLLDPWHAGGVLKDVNPTVKAILVEEGAHHLDLRSAHPADPVSVIAARQEEVRLIKQWLEREKNSVITD